MGDQSIQNVCYGFGFAINNNENAENFKSIMVEIIIGENFMESNNKDENEENAIGWDAIEAEAERIYVGQNNPIHYGALIKWRLGGPDPLDGISVYDGGDYWHFVTFGLSELYEKESEDKEWSGYGMESTLHLKKDKNLDSEQEEKEIKNICGVLQQIARITFNTNEIFSSYEYIYTGQTQGIDSQKKSNITGFITIPDTKFQTLNTQNGKVEFIEFIGATNNELLAVKNKEIDVKTLYEKLGSDVTDYNRKSVI